MLLSILLAIPYVQTRLGKVATDYLNKDFDTNITVDKISLSVFGGVELKDIEILDHHLDSMINVDRLETSIYSYRNIIRNKLEFGDIELEGVKFFIKIYKGERKDAFGQFIQSFDKNKKEKKPSGFLLRAASVFINDLDLVIIDENNVEKGPVSFSGVTGPVENFEILGPNIKGDVRGLSFVDNNNIEVTNLMSDFSYSRKGMKLLNTIVETKLSKVLIDATFFREGSFADFTNKVKFEGNVKQADISLVDLHKFYGELGGDDVIHFKTKLKGTLNNFRAMRFKLNSDLETIVEGNFHLKNLFNSKREFSIDADLSSVVSEYDNLTSLLPNILSKSLPSTIKEFGRFDISGKSLITKDAIDANIQMNTEIGSLITELKLTNIDDIDKASYKGHIKIIDFDFGRIAKDSLIGKMSLDADVDGQSFTIENLNTTVVGEIYRYEYKGFVYDNIDVNGRFQNKKFEGELIIDNPYLNMNFNGLADLSKEVYKFDFETVVAYADFNELNLFTRDSIAILKGDIDIDLEGNTIEDIRGTIDFERASYTNQNGRYYFEDFNITSTFKDSVRTVELNSKDIIRGEIVGDFKFVELPKLAKNAVGSIYSNYEPFKVEKGQYLDFKFNIYNKVIDIFFPGVYVASKSFISGSMNSDDKDFELTVKSPKIVAHENIIEDVRLQVDNKNPLFNTQLTINQIDTKNYDISDFNMVNVTLNDTLFFRTEFKAGIEKKDVFNLGFYHTIDEDNNSVVGLNKSDILYKGTEWLINPAENKKNKVVFDNGFEKVNISELEMISDEQRIGLRGFSEGRAKKDFNLVLENVNLERVTPEIEGWNFTGLINGTLDYTQDDSGLRPIANLQIEDFTVNDSYQGDLKIGMIGRKSNQTYALNLSLENDDYDALFANGIIDFAPKEPIIDLAFEFEKFKLDILSPIGDVNFTNMRGQIYGNARLSGLLKNPDMNGEFYLFDAGLAMPYLEVDYDFEGTTVLELHGQTFEIIDLTLKDIEEDTRGTLTGSISHNYFKDWNLDLNLKTDNLLVLNTPETEESLYYGQAYVDGQASISGYTDNLNIEVNGKTNKGTYFVIPLNTSTDIGSSALVEFSRLDNVEEITELTGEDLFNRIKGLSLNFNLEITKDAVVEMVLDKVTGSKLRGSGTGDLLIEIDGKDKFNIYGDFVVDNGIYNFNFKDIINKEFTASKGGTISWNGDPFDAELDIETMIRVYANPKYLLENVYTSRNIAVDLVARFSGPLFDSRQEYDILIPNADSELKAELDFKLNGSNDLNTKMNNFGSLLLFGTFSNDESSLGDNSRMMIAGISEEFLSSALTNIVNAGDSKVQFGVSYDVGDTRSSVENLQTDDQLGITVATQVNDRILVDGKIGVPVGSTNQSSGLIGEIEVDFLLNPQGTLRSSVFNRQNQIQYNEEEQGYTQGVGLTYQFDFDTSKEFLQKIGLKKTEKGKDSLVVKKDSIPVKKSFVDFGNTSKN